MWRPSIPTKELASKKLAPTEHSHQETWPQNWGLGGHYSLHMWCSPTQSAGGFHRSLFGQRRRWVRLTGTRACRGWGQGASMGRLELGVMTMGQRRPVQVCLSRLSHPTQDWPVCRWNRRIWWLSVTKSKTRGQFCFRKELIQLSHAIPSWVSVHINNICYEKEEFCH